jgi:hypothetical protein
MISPIKINKTTGIKVKVLIVSKMLNPNRRKPAVPLQNINTPSRLTSTKAKATGIPVDNRISKKLKITKSTTHHSMQYSPPGIRLGAHELSTCSDDVLQLRK